MGANLKKLSILILLPLIFSSCEFFIKESHVKGVRTPQSEGADPEQDPAPSNTPASDAKNNLINTVQEKNEWSQVRSAEEIIESSPVNSPERESNIAKLCSLPREFANPALYDKYCSFTCRAVDKRCEDHKDCCSHRCSGGICQPGSNHFVPVGERCHQSSDCETGLCQMDPNNSYKICYGSVSRGVCSFPTETCTQDDNCCSLKCYNNKCIGSPKNPVGALQPCYLDNNECASNQCDFGSHTCR